MKHHPPHRHRSQAQLQQEIREGIALQGFALRHVLEADDEPAFSYTVGLHTQQSQRPELLISGLHIETRVAWLLELGFRMQGPPPLHTRRQIALSQGVPLERLDFPPGGQIFQPGVCYRGLADNDLPACFGLVAREQYAAHFGQALAFHGSATFPVLQLVWTDPQGHFPWDRNFDQKWSQRQRLLFDPQIILPLREEQAG
jgi:hypothetical protein